MEPGVCAATWSQAAGVMGTETVCLALCPPDVSEVGDGIVNDKLSPCLTSPTPQLAAEGKGMWFRGEDF